jgi:integrase
MDLEKLAKQYNGVKVEKTKMYWHDVYKGFGLRLNPSGKHTWVSYTTTQNKKAYKTIHYSTVAYKVAIKAFLDGKHDKYLLDVIESTNAAKASPTIREFSTEFIKKHLDVEWKEAKDSVYVVKAIVKAIGHVRIGELTVQDVEYVKSSASTKSAANKALRILSVMFKKAVVWGYVKGPNGATPGNPCALVAKYKMEPRTHHLNSEEFDRLWASLEMDINVPVRCAIQLMCLTGARKEEVLGLTWKDIDFKGGVINITPERAKNSRTHFIKITPMIYHVLRSVPQEGTYLFPSPSNRNGHIQDIRKPFDRIKARANVPVETTIHDIRRSVSCYLKSQGHDDMSIAAALNHKSVSTTRNHYIHIERKKMAEVIQDLSDKFFAVNDKIINQSSISPSSSSS